MKLKSVLSHLVLIILLLIFVFVGIRISVWCKKTSENFYKFLDFIDNTIEKDEEIRNVLESLEDAYKESIESETKATDIAHAELISSEITDTTFPISITADSIAIFKDSAFPTRESGKLEWIEFGPWDNFINSLKNAYIINSTNEINPSTTCIVIETYMCNQRWWEFYDSVLNEKITRELKIVILSPYNSTDSNYSMHTKYVKMFLESVCYADTNITIYFYDDTYQTFYYEVD